MGGLIYVIRHWRLQQAGSDFELAAADASSHHNQDLLAEFHYDVQLKKVGGNMCMKGNRPILK